MNGGIFQGSNTSDFSSGVVDLFTIPANANPSSTALTAQAITNSSTFQYVRYLSPGGSFGNISELEFWGTTPSSTVSATFESGAGSLSNAGGTNTSNNVYTSTNGIKLEALNQYSNGFTLPTQMGNQVLHTNNYGETIRISRTNGASFNLSSIDFVTGQYESWATGLITIRAYQAGSVTTPAFTYNVGAQGNSTRSTLASAFAGWTNLTKVEIAVANTTINIDNVVIA
jgi:hypothetical protein